MQNISLTRRTFVASSCAVAGAMLMPKSLLATNAPASQVGYFSGTAGAAAVSREFANAQGISRPRAWRLPGGASLEFVDSIAGGADFRLSGSFGSDETFMAEDLKFGRPQEMIRRRFGDDVLNELIEEVDRCRSTARSRGE